MRLVAPIARSTLAHSSRLWTPSDLVQYYESPFASWMDRLAAEHPAHPLAARRDPPDPFLSMLGKKGLAGEQEAMRKLFLGLGLGVADLSAEARGDALAQRALVTAEAMRERPDVIYQAPLAAGSFAGVADFLVRSDLLGRDEASRGDPALYTVWDAKLTRHVRPQQLIQLCCYAEMLAEMQGARPETVSLVLGGSAARVASFRLAEHRAHFASLRRRFLAFHAGFDAAAEPPAAPTRSAPAGQWRGLADAELLARDDLRLVARLSQRQAALLSAAGVRSAAALAELPPGQAVGGVERAALSRLREQASLQLQARGAPDEPPPYRLLPWSRAAGLALLPPPSPSDLFFDLEGFPLAEGHAPEGPAAPPERLADFAANGAADEAARGREYLWGAATRGGHVAASAAAGGGGGGGAALFENDDEFVAWWAHSYAQEKAALEGFVDWAVSLKRSEPRMHIYHYGAYEVSALRRLAMRHATREAEVDELLRGGALVDLYAVVRGGLLLGTENYSIKSVEKLYRGGGGGGRDTAVAKGDQSVVVYDAWLEAPDGSDAASSATLASLLEYNRDDCISTRQLADWVWRLRTEHPAAPPAAPPADAGPAADDPSGGAAAPAAALSERAAEEAAEVEELERLLASSTEWPEGSPLASEQVRSTLSALLHFHKREAKPGWWRRFDWLAAAPEAMVEDERTLGMLRRTGAPPYKTSPRKRRMVYEYEAEPQPSKLEAGAAVVLCQHGGGDADDGERAGGVGLPAALVTADAASGTFGVECSVEPAGCISLLPDEYVDASPIPAAVRAAVRSLAERPEEHTALSCFLARRPPRALQGGAGEPAAAASVSSVVAAALRLESDYLCVQGPPGTGKTFVGSRAAAALIAAGRRVGVLAHSHAAVHNMVEKTIGALSRAGARGRVVKIGGDKEEAARLQRGCGEGLRVERVASASALKGEPLDEDVLLVGGTAWAFSSEALAGQVDVLLVDEAGQLPLANLVGASRAADSLVLLGDQMQLPAPCEGTHPAESGRSGLEYLLRGEPTVPPSLGVFLSESHRLHPALCSLVSELVYSGRLSSHASAARRSLALGQRPPAAGCPPRLRRAAGVECVDVEHRGNSQSSSEEARVVAELCDELLGADLLDGGGAPRALRWEDIVVVAPYNAQVRLLRSVLGPKARVGTVDRFQGQEAPVVLLSLCHSDFAAADTADAGLEGEAAAAGGGRGLSFVLNPNRLNVALTRAQCLAVVVASPRLAEAPVRSVRQLREVNFLARIREVGGATPEIDGDEPPLGGG